MFRNMDVIDDEDQQLLELQRKIGAQSENNRKMIETALAAIPPDQNGDDVSESESESDSEIEDELMKSGSSRKRSVVVQIDDERDEDLVLLLDPTFPQGFFTSLNV